MTVRGAQRRVTLPWGHPHPGVCFCSRALLLVYAVPDMMFGFGDVEAPLQSTVDTMEDLVTSYVQTLVKKAQEGRASGSRTQLTEQDLAHLPAADQPARLLERFRTRWARGAQTSPGDPGSSLRAGKFSSNQRKRRPRSHP